MNQTAQPIVITLAGRPVGKGRPRFMRKTGHAYTPERTRTYETSLAGEAQRAMGDRPLLQGPLACWVIAAKDVPASWSKRRRAEALTGHALPITKPDWDNFAKVCDALNGIVWTDDSLVCDGRVFKHFAEKPSMTVVVAPMRLPFVMPPMYEIGTYRSTNLVDIFA